MAETLVMLALSPTMETGTITSWHKKEGEEFGVGDLLCEVETDKATMDYESTTEGVLLKIVAPEGSSVRVGDPIAVAGEAGEDISSLLKQISGKGKEKVSKEKEKRELTPPPPRKEEERVPSLEREPPEVSEPELTTMRASPLAREIARQKRIDLRTVRGSGPRGRIVKEDVERATAGGVVEAPVKKADESIAVSQMRSVIAKRLSESKFSAPHYYLTVSVCVDRMIAARSELNEGREKKVSLNAFLMKFVAEALKRNPVVNSTWAGDEIIRHHSQDIGIAVALEDGLITPVVRDCGSRGIIAIDEELRELVKKSREGRLTPEEYTGATFTICNLGSYGVRQFTAIINPPGSSILAVGEIFKEFSADGSGVKSTMLLTLSNDHRVIDGAVAARFASDLKKIMENPVTVFY